MTTREAKEILLLYRPGTADSEDSSFTQALQLCEQDEELKAWFEAHCSVYQSLRGSLKQMPVPEGLKEQILAERIVKVPTFWNAPKQRVVMAGLTVAAVAILLLFQWLPPAQETGYPGFRDRMISKALRSYRMDLETENPERVRAYLAEQKAISNYELPQGLQRAKMTGCAATTWQGKPVSMICFHSGKPLRPGQTSDLWLFIAESTSVPDAHPGATPRTEQVHTVTAASWSDKGKTYVLAIEGDAETLKKYL
ncbi:MAG: hypothetical protein H7Y43_01795 [Akkermansiaceae bacterium]|nr:hypothetical protein [Verrucomicrobiales bacterium]